MAEEAGRNDQERLVFETFERQASVYADKYEAVTSEAHSFQIRRQRVCELLGDVEGGKLLDIGCGPGVTVEHLAGRGVEFHGVDISRKMIDECNQRFGHLDSVHFSVGRIESLEFPDSFFDAIVCMGVVEYIDDDDAAVREMARVVRDGGAIVITLPNHRSPYRVWERIVYRNVIKVLKIILGRKIEPAVGHREYKESAYRRLLESHRLTVTDVAYYNFKLMLAPLDVFLPRLTVWTSRRLEFLCRGALRWLGTGFIVRAEKKPAAGVRESTQSPWPASPTALHRSGRQGSARRASPTSIALQAVE